MSEEQNMIEEQVEMNVDNSELREVIENKFSDVHNKAMILGFRVCCKSILEKIIAFERSPSKKSNNDHKRLIKDIKTLCEIGISRKMNIDGEITTDAENT